MSELNQEIINDFVFKLKKQLYVSKLEDLKLTLYPDAECPYIYINLIKIKKGYRNQGIGTLVMQDIINFANVHHIQLQLYAVDVYGSELRRLYRFYRKLGFVLIKNNSDNNFLYKPKKNHNPL
ncbi:MAG: GNAT family N-acetyltransferase [Bacteroidales bacterium]|nr:GNAT family N-acetyltransferase [Bacteroidales bacterium]